MEKGVLPMRASGILMHISSLPSPGGIGSLGREAFDFADFLQASGFRIWQVLLFNSSFMLFFLNKTDREEAAPDEVLAQIRKKLTLTMSAKTRPCSCGAVLPNPRIV